MVFERETRQNAKGMRTARLKGRSEIIIKKIRKETQSVYKSNENKSSALLDKQVTEASYMPH